MNLPQISGVIIGCILGVIGLLKLELIKELAKKITSNKKMGIVYIIVILLIIVSLPTIIGFNIQEATSSTNESVETEQALQQKTDAEVAAGVAETIADNVQAAIQENKRKKVQKDSIFIASRNQRWVYCLGDEMDNDEAIRNFYQNLMDNSNVCLFRDNKRYFFFWNSNRTKTELNDSLSNFQMRIGKFIAVNIIDLMEYCKTENMSIIQTNSKKIGKRRKQLKIDCYTVK